MKLGNITKRRRAAVSEQLFRANNKETAETERFRKVVKQMSETPCDFCGTGNQFCGCRLVDL